MQRKKTSAASETPQKPAEAVIPGQMVICPDGSVKEAQRGTEGLQDTLNGQRVEEIGEQIIAIMKSGTKRWIELYQLIRRVEDEQLYLPAYHSLTAWARRLSEKGGFQLRELWRYKKAGRYYAEYTERQERAGKRAVPLEDIDTRTGASISPRNFERIEKIAGGDTAVADRLIGQMLGGAIKAPELEQLWKAKKAAGGHVRKSRHDAGSGGEGPAAGGEENKQRAVEIFAAIQNANDGSWLPERHIVKPWITDKYRVFAEFPVHSGTTDNAARIDAMVVETFGVEREDDVFMHAIEIKVDQADLEHDAKMQEYADFADYMWIAVSEGLAAAAIRHAEELEGSAKWGVLEVCADGSMRVARTPERLRGLMRDKSLEWIVHKLI